MLFRPVRFLLLITMTAGLTACAGRTATPTTAPAPQPSAGATSATEAMLAQQGQAGAIARARADSARLPWTVADVQFMTNMIGHHAQAIVMSRLAPTHGATPAVLRLAERIINAQQDEIRTMQRWLSDRLQPVPNPEQPANAMGGHEGMDHSMHGMMPGMLSAAQLRELDTARGADFDDLFLRYMIQHHKGATSMVTTLFGTIGAGLDETVFKFASDVNVDQTTEIARMNRMRFELQLLRGGTQK
jgi:uncharacterized protein (DUF305 family)